MRIAYALVTIFTLLAACIVVLLWIAKRRGALCTNDNISRRKIFSLGSIYKSREEEDEEKQRKDSGTESSL